MTSLATHSETRFRAWLQDHLAVFWKVARSFSALESDQSDLVQEMQLQIWQALPNFRGEAKPSTWIYRICLNTALSWRRSSERRGLGRHEPAEESTLPAHPGPDPSAEIERRDLLEQLYAAIRALPASDRSLVLMHLDGLDYEEIGQVTGMTTNHVGVALTRARKRLTALMKGVVHELG
jgi:RNA polymerase sigma-70 factor, ECF subfamily